MKHRVVIITEIIAPYRIPVFNALAQHPEIDLNVIFLARTDPSTRQWRGFSEEKKISYDIFSSWGTRVKKNNLLLNQNIADALRPADPGNITCGCLKNLD